MWLTPDEWERYEEHNRVQDEAGERLDPYLAEHPESFAGVWLGPGLDPEYNVALTGDLETHREALLRLYPRPDVIRVHPARYTAVELEGISDQIAGDADELAGVGVKWMGSGVDVERNRVEVDVVAPDANSAVAVLRDRYGPAVVCEWLGGNETEVVAVPWQLWTIDTAGRELTVHYSTLRANEHERVDCDEELDSVYVTVFVRTPVGPAQPIGAFREATVALERPLADRRVIDGATGRERAARG